MAVKDLEYPRLIFQAVTEKLVPGVGRGSNDNNRAPGVAVTGDR